MRTTLLLSLILAGCTASDRYLVNQAALNFQRGVRESEIHGARRDLYRAEARYYNSAAAAPAAPAPHQPASCRTTCRESLGGAVDCYSDCD
jgi:hypothetical protein